MNHQNAKIDISDFLLQGTLGPLIQLQKPFGPIRNSLPTKPITESDGDIPALFAVFYQDLMVEVGVLTNCVVSISIKLEDNSEVGLTFGAWGELNDQTNFVGLVQYLNRQDIPWQIYEGETRGKTVGISFSSGASMLFSFEKDFFQLFQFVALNWDYYNLLSQQMKDSSAQD